MIADVKQAGPGDVVPVSPKRELGGHWMGTVARRRIAGCVVVVALLGATGVIGAGGRSGPVGA